MLSPRTTFIAAALLASIPAAGFSQQQDARRNLPDAQTTPGAQNVAPGGTADFNDLSPTPWFADPATRNQLRLSNTQYEELQRIYENQYQEYQRNLQQQLEADLQAEQRAVERNRLRQQFQRDLNRRVEREFQDAPFRSRFRQLARQYQGYGAFADPDVQQSLSLTPQQRTRLNRLDAEWDRDVNALMRRHRNNPQQLQRDFADLQRQRARNVNSILAQEQLQSWREMVGDPYDFPITSYVPGGDSQSLTDAIRLRGQGPTGVTRPGSSTVPDVSP